MANALNISLKKMEKKGEKWQIYQEVQHETRGLVDILVFSGTELQCRNKVQQLRNMYGGRIYMIKPANGNNQDQRIMKFESSNHERIRREQEENEWALTGDWTYDEDFDQITEIIRRGEE